MSVFTNLARRFILPSSTKSDGLRMAFDLEANALLDTASKIHCIVIADLDSEQVDKYGPEQINAALEHLARADYLAGHRIQSYDLALLARLHGWQAKPGCAILDTLIAARLILPNIADLDDQAAGMGDPKLGTLRGRYSLEAWGARLSHPKIGTDITDWSVFTPEMLERCVNDAILTKKVWEFLNPDGYDHRALALEHRVDPICERITRDGVPFDREAAERLREQWEAQRAALKAQLQTQFPGTNLNSRQQIGALLEARGWIPKKRTEKTGQPSITDEVLETIPALFSEFAGIAGYDLLRRRIAQLATGEQAWLKHIGDDGRIHGGLVHIGTPHSRAKHLAPNLAQTPNPKKGAPHAAECRALFRHPGDWVFVKADQSNFQDRAFADRLAEFDGGAYGQAFLAGEDRHWKNATALGLVCAGTERDKDSNLHTTIREWAKTFGYGFLFGAGVGRCTEILTDAVRAIQNIDPTYTASTDGGRARERFIAAIPGLAQLKDKLERQAAQHQWLPGLDGRRVPCRAQYAALNYAVASMEAVVCKQWLANTYTELCARFKYGWDGDVVIVLWVHDEIVCCCRPEIADEVGELMVRHAIEAGDHYGLRVPLAADYKIGRSWAGEPVEAGAKPVELEPANAVAPELAPIADEVEVVAADDDDPLAELLDGDNHSDSGEIKIERADNEIAAIFDEGDRIRPTGAPEIYCQSCGRNFKNTRLAPMLHNEIWCQLSDKRGTLCGKCMFDRAIERGVTLTIANLRPCRFNLLGSPQSWFDIFLCAETRPLENLAAWQAVAVEWLGPQDGLLAAEATLRTLARLPRAVRGNGQSSGAGDDSAQRAARVDPRAGRASGGNGAGADDRPPWSAPTITEVPPGPKLEQIVAALSAEDRAIVRPPKPNSGGAKSFHGSGNGKFHCPFHDDNTPSLQIYSDTDDPHYHCFGCGKHGPLSELPDELIAATAARQQADDAETLAYAHRLWEAAGSIAGTLAERYLAATRGVDLDALPPDVDRALRFHPACPFNGGRHPCLLALFRDVGTDEPAGIHRIALTPEARKIDRRMLGRWPAPRAIKLWPATDRLYWGEGIETVGAAATRVIHRGAPMQPAWAAGSSGNLAKLPIIPGVERLIILVDNDLNGAGQAAATRCVERWSRAGRTVVKLTPKRPGADFNDIAKEKAP